MSLMLDDRSCRSFANDVVDTAHLHCVKRGAAKRRDMKEDSRLRERNEVFMIMVKLKRSIVRQFVHASTLSIPYPFF